MSNDAIKTRTIIGLEIHVQLLTKPKMFCGCPVIFDAPPNTCVCPVCLGHPGALPVVNRKAFELSVLTGMPETSSKTYRLHPSIPFIGNLVTSISIRFDDFSVEPLIVELLWPNRHDVLPGTHAVRHLLDNRLDPRPI